MISEGRLKKLQELHGSKIIDKRQVLWWQLGFEGRRVLSEDEFESGLEEISYEVHFNHSGERIDPKIESYKIWVRDDVPIIIKEIDIGGNKYSAFVSVKPISHREGVWSGKEALEISKSQKLPPNRYHGPHVRGILVEQTEDFIFWNPIILGREPKFYDSSVFLPKDSSLPWMICPIHPSEFYKNIISRGWGKGKRNQKKASSFEDENFETVPYSEFDPSKRHLTVYPASIKEKELDFPVILKGDINEKMPSILGIGYLNFAGNGSAAYWELDKGKERIARQSLIKRLGRIS